MILNSFKISIDKQLIKAYTDGIEAMALLG